MTTRKTWAGLVLAASVLFAAFPGAPAAAVVRVLPGSDTVGVGAELLVSIAVSDIVDLYAYQFDLTFDPAVLHLNTIAEGGFLPGGGTTFFIPGTIDNIAGIASLTLGTLVGAASGVSGDGVLAEFRFDALAAGFSGIELINGIFLDSGLADIGVEVVPGAVGVVAEPSMMALALLVATGLCLRRGWRSARRARQSAPRH